MSPGTPDNPNNRGRKRRFWNPSKLLLLLCVLTGSELAVQTYDRRADVARPPVVCSQPCVSLHHSSVPELSEMPEGIEQVAQDLERMAAAEDRRVTDDQLAACTDTVSAAMLRVWLEPPSQGYPELVRMAAPAPAIGAQFTCVGSTWRVVMRTNSRVIAEKVH